ncbi:MAG: phosphoserine phosphatase SerB [Geminicoccaceae bacterium]
MRAGEMVVKVLTMSNILVVIANPARDPLTPAMAQRLGRQFKAAPRWLAPGEAFELVIEAAGPRCGIRAEATRQLADQVDPKTLDIAVLPAGDRRKRLLISDMDSTIITVECIDELADYFGVKSEVAEITRRAMMGELVFADALRERVRLLAGLPVEIIDQVYAERVRLMPGADLLMRWMRGSGAVTALVSGGFVPFAERVAKKLGFDDVVANHLDVVRGRLTGKVLPPITGPDIKLSTLRRLSRDHDLPPQETLAVGDGVNDLPMIKAAGLGVAFRAHAPVAEASEVAIQVGDLTALLYLQGVPKRDFLPNKCCHHGSIRM